MIDWTSIILSALTIVTTGGFAFQIVDRRRYKKEEKTLKQDTVAKAETDTDRQQIDLGDIFLEKTQKWAEVIEGNSHKMVEMMSEREAKRDGDFKRIFDGLELLTNKVEDIEEYLDGPFNNYKRDKYAKTSKRVAKRPVPKRRTGNAGADVQDVQVCAASH